MKLVSGQQITSCSISFESFSRGQSKYCTCFTLASIFLKLKKKMCIFWSFLHFLPKNDSKFMVHCQHAKEHVFLPPSMQLLSIYSIFSAPSKKWSLFGPLPMHYLVALPMSRLLAQWARNRQSHGTSADLWINFKSRGHVLQNLTVKHWKLKGHAVTCW